MVVVEQPRRARRRQPGARGDRGGLQLPKVSINGATGEELDTALATMIRFQRGGVDYTVLGSVPPAAARGGGARSLMTARAPVEVRGLVKLYGDVVAVDHVDLTVEAGDVYGYLGPNGAGKTTVAADAARPDPARPRARCGCSGATRIADGAARARGRGRASSRRRASTPT